LKRAVTEKDGVVIIDVGQHLNSSDALRLYQCAGTIRDYDRYILINLLKVEDINDYGINTLETIRTDFQHSGRLTKLVIKDEKIKDKILSKYADYDMVESLEAGISAFPGRKRHKIATALKKVLDAINSRFRSLEERRKKSANE